MINEKKIVYLCFKDNALFSVCYSREVLAQMVLLYNACGYQVKTKELMVNAPYKNALINDEMFNFKLDTNEL